MHNLYPVSFCITTPIDIFLKSDVKGLIRSSGTPICCQFKNLNHLGLVAAMCRELKIAEYFDARITNDSDARNVTIGQAVVAMIINGLG